MLQIGSAHELNELLGLFLQRWWRRIESMDCRCLICWSVYTHGVWSLRYLNESIYSYTRCRLYSLIDKSWASVTLPGWHGDRPANDKKFIVTNESVADKYFLLNRLCHLNYKHLFSTSELDLCGSVYQLRQTRVIQWNLAYYLTSQWFLSTYWWPHSPEGLHRFAHSLDQHIGTDFLS